MWAGGPHGEPLSQGPEPALVRVGPVAPQAPQAPGLRDSGWALGLPEGQSQETQWTRQTRDCLLFRCSVVCFCDPTDCSPPGSSVQGILQTRTLEQIAVPSSRGSSRPRDEPASPAGTGGFFTDAPPGSPDQIITGMLQSPDHSGVWKRQAGWRNGVWRVGRPL